MIKLPSDYDFIEMNPQFEFALDKIINTQDNLHIIGPAGVGKSTLIKIISDSRILKGNTAVVAPTGIAAVNASSHGLKATTIHSLFKFPPYTIYPDSLLRINEELEPVINCIDNLVMDEASMCNASLFDFMIEELRLYRAKKEKSLPRLFIVADPLQLPPVISNKDPEIKKYFDILYNGKFMYFSSLSFPDLQFSTIQLNKIYRQKDSSIQNVFNRLRQGTFTNADLDILNSRVIKEEDFAKERGMYVYLAMDNNTVNEVNDSFLEFCDGPMYEFHAQISGKFDLSVARHLQEHIYLKKGYQVMVTRNSPATSSQSYFNGTLGEVVFCNDRGSKDEQEVSLRTNTGIMLNIPRGDFQQFSFDRDENGNLQVKEEGKFNQILVKGAHALTIHKTQGLTLDSIFFDLGKWVGTTGLSYVALSRCKTLEGIGLSRPIKASDIKVNREVLDFLAKVL